ncbi:MAG: DNA-protecting protein DprA [Oscillospiraceae bacterium]|nr:DNA-protecting protein DprA [Oscillospiraceae bacterium]
MLQEKSIILSLCCQLCRVDGIRPLSTREYLRLKQALHRNSLCPADLVNLSSGELMSILGTTVAFTQRIRELLDRSVFLLPFLELYEAMGFQTVTVTDPLYPKTLLQTLPESCPALLFYAGDLSLAQKPVVGFVGSRAISEEDASFSRATVQKVLSQGYGVVSGGARGTDTVAEETALAGKGFVVEFPADSLTRRTKKLAVRKMLEEGRMLLLHPVGPGVNFTTSIAMTRNRLIYAQSQATVVVRSDLNAGGTWAGATDALKHSLCPVLCRDYPYEGNRALLQLGAHPITSDWDGSLPPKILPVSGDTDSDQLSLFDMMDS